MELLAFVRDHQSLHRRRFDRSSLTESAFPLLTPFQSTLRAVSRRKGERVSRSEVKVERKRYGGESESGNDRKSVYNWLQSKLIFPIWRSAFSRISNNEIMKTTYVDQMKNNKCVKR